MSFHLGLWIKSETLFYNQKKQLEYRSSYMKDTLRQAVVRFQTVKSLWMKGKEKAH